MTETPPSSSDDASPAVSAVVVNYNGGERLLKTLEALVRQTYPLEAITVYDNASTDDALQHVRERMPTVRVHDLGGNYGPARARNEGMELAESALVVLVDNDVYVEPDTIARLVEAWQRTQAAVICPRVRLLPESDTVQADGADCHFTGTMILRHGYQPVASLPTASQEVGGAISACLLVDRAKALEAGGFDELFFIYQEDLEFGMRMRTRGHTFVVEPAAEVYHDRGEGVVGLSYRGHERRFPPRRAYLNIRNRLLVILIYYRWRTLVVLSPVLASYDLASLGIALVRGFGWQWVRAWGWILAHGGTIRQRRRRVQSARTCNDKALLEGGPIPLAPGFIRNRIAGGLLRAYSAACNGYWRLARHLIA